MSALFPYADTAVAILILVVGFGFHFCGQLVSVLDWDLARKWGLQEANCPADYYPYEHGTAMADALIGWVYPVAAFGLLMGANWGYALTWVPGTILLYHGLGAWFCEADRRRAGHGLWTDRFRILWCGANALTGGLAVAVAWTGPVA